jgi:hypothetical protein
MVFLPVVLPTIFDHAAAVRKQGIHLQRGGDKGSGRRLT